MWIKFDRELLVKNDKISRRDSSLIDIMDYPISRRTSMMTRRCSEVRVYSESATVSGFFQTHMYCTVWYTHNVHPHRQLFLLIKQKSWARANSLTLNPLIFLAQRHSFLLRKSSFHSANKDTVYILYSRTNTGNARWVSVDPPSIQSSIGIDAWQVQV